MSKSSRRTGRAGRGRRGTSGATEVFHRGEPGLIRQIVCLLIRIRAELALFAVLFTAWLYLYLRYSPIISYAVPGGVFVALMAVPASRRFIVRRAWAVVSRHRLRACMVQIRTMNFDGLLPWMIWSRPTPVGERIWMWMRPGISIDDLSGRLEHLAVACWARDTRVQRSRRVAALVTVDVIRRDPLTSAKEPIPSPLRLVGKDGPTPPPVDISTSEPSPFRKAKADADARNTGGAVNGASRTTTRKSTRTDRPAASPGLVVNGEDISDYVD